MSLRLIGQFFRQSFAVFTAYRLTSIFVIVFGSLFSIIELVTTLVYFQFTDRIAGYTLNQFLLLIASFSFISNLYQFLFIAAHEQMADKIIDGKLDYDFIRPLDSQLYNSLSAFDIGSSINLVIPLILIIYSIDKTGGTGVLRCLFFTLFLLVGTFAYYLINQFFVSLSFWIERPGKLLGIPEYLFDLASRPRAVYPKVLQIIFAWILPIISATNLPVQILTGRVTIIEISTYLIAISLLALIVRIQWKQGVKRYQSAN